MAGVIQQVSLQPRASDDESLFISAQQNRRVHDGTIKPNRRAVEIASVGAAEYQVSQHTSYFLMHRVLVLCMLNYANDLRNLLFYLSNYILSDNKCKAGMGGGGNDLDHSRFSDFQPSSWCMVLFKNIK